MNKLDLAMDMGDTKYFFMFASGCLVGPCVNPVRDYLG